MKRLLACLASLALAAPVSGAAQARMSTAAQVQAGQVQAGQAEAAQVQAAQAQPSARAGVAQADPIGELIAQADPVAPENGGDWKLRATLYHGGRGMHGRDSLGCPVSPMRTVAADRGLVSRRSIIFIKETVGMPLPDGGVHDGYWYVSDIGSAIRGERIDLFTGHDAASMRPLMGLNMKTLTVSKVGEFSGCPPVDGGGGARIAQATN